MHSLLVFIEFNIYFILVLRCKWFYLTIVNEFEIRLITIEIKT